MKKSSLLLLSFILVACGQQQKQQRTSYHDIKNICEISIPQGRNDSEDEFNRFFTYHHHVALETNDSCLIGRIGKIKINNKKIYILDSQQQRIVIFDENGKFITQFYRQGQSGKEYIRLTDFDLYGDNLYILDGMAGKLLTYKWPEGTFLTSTQIEKAKQLVALDSIRFALNIGLGYADGRSEDKCHSYAVTESGEAILTDIPYNQALCGMNYSFGEGMNYTYRDKNDILMYFPFNDTLYHVNNRNGKLAPMWVIKKGDIHITHETPSQEVKELSKKIPASIFCLYLWKNAIQFSYYPSDGSVSKNVLADTDGNILFCGTWRLDSNRLPVRVIPYETDEERYLLSALYPHVLSSIFKHSASKSIIGKEILSQTDIDSNPILVFYQFNGSNIP